MVVSASATAPARIAPSGETPAKARDHRLMVRPLTQGGLSSWAVELRVTAVQTRQAPARNRNGSAAITEGARPDRHAGTRIARHRHGHGVATEALHYPSAG